MEENNIVRRLTLLFKILIQKYFRDFHTGACIYTISTVSPPPTSSMPTTPSQIHNLFIFFSYQCVVTHMHTCVRAHTHTLLNPFSVAHTYLCLEFITWN